MSMNNGTGKLEKSTLSLRNSIEKRFERKSAAEEFKHIYEEITDHGVKPGL
ncbi:hypothetical protein MASR2M79_22710 [Aminivibrio sp.]